jgi:cardiolipin synthase
MLIHVLQKSENPTFKLAWAIFILLLPVMGGALYFLFGSDTASRPFSKKYNQISTQISRKLSQNPYVLDEIRENDSVLTQVNYITKVSRYPIYKNTKVTYLSPGEVKWEALLQALEKAERYIFLEYFIINKGIMWDSILEILKKKAAEGVDVRVIYDDFGCLMTLPENYAKTLRSYGIKCHVFNPFTPMLLIRMNNRDHRKIAIIDGHTAFCGGINLADEYINAFEKHGHWKDASVMLYGEAVYSLTLMFLKTWQFCSGKSEDLNKFLPSTHSPKPFESDGYVLPYEDTPTDTEPTGERIYINAVSRATKSVWFQTPYLIIGAELLLALKLAAKSGVDVRIITPHVADKWYVHNVTQTYYAPLIEAGVKIYEYTPGFIHSKVMICDGVLATVGTINLDFRSLYHHFECGVLMYQNSAIGEIIKDYEKTLEICERITLEKAKKVPFYKRILRIFLRLFSPLM